MQGAASWEGHAWKDGDAGREHIRDELVGANVCKYHNARVIPYRVMTRTEAGSVTI